MKYRVVLEPIKFIDGAWNPVVHVEAYYLSDAISKAEAEAEGWDRKLLWKAQSVEAVGS